MVAVGEGSLVWPDTLQANQSTYHPPFIATNEGTIETAVIASSISPPYLRGVLTSSPVPSNYQIWHTPFVQHCDKVVHKAYPSDKITPPTNPISGSDQTFFSVESACINLALFTTIAKAVGKDLTIATFEKAGYGLRNATIPGAASSVSLSPGRSYPLGPVILVTYDPTKNVLDFANSAVGKCPGLVLAVRADDEQPSCGDHVTRVGHDRDGRNIEAGQVSNEEQRGTEHSADGSRFRRRCERAGDHRSS